MNPKSVKTQNLSVFLLCHPYFVDKKTDIAQTPYILRGIPEVGGWSIPSSLFLFNQGRHLCRKPSKASSFHSSCNGGGLGEQVSVDFSFYDMRWVLLGKRVGRESLLGTPSVSATAFSHLSRISAPSSPL